MSRKREAQRERIRLLIEFRDYFPGLSRYSRLPIKLLLAVAFPRFGVLYFHRMNKSLHLRGLKAPAYLCYLANYYLNHADISPYADLGVGVQISHPLGIVIGGSSKVGPRTAVLSCVTLGTNSARANYSGYPDVGADCYIGTGARLIGPVKIGSRCVVGANSVVVHDVAPGLAVVGVPAKPLPGANN